MLREAERSGLVHGRTGSPRRTVNGRIGLSTDAFHPLRTDALIPRADYLRGMSPPVRMPDTATAYCAT